MEKNIKTKMDISTHSDKKFSNSNSHFSKNISIHKIYSNYRSYYIFLSITEQSIRIIIFETQKIFQKEYSFNELKKRSFFYSDQTINEVYLTINEILKKNQCDFHKLEKKIKIELYDEIRRKKLTTDFLIESANLTDLSNEIGFIDILSNNIFEIEKELNEKTEENHSLRNENNYLINSINELKSSIRENNELIKEFINHKKNFTSSSEIYQLNKEISFPINTYLKFCNFSKILIEEDLQLIIKFLCNKNVKFDLLYSSEFHGQNVETFHKKCDGISNTLTLISSEKENRFGGFSAIPWSSKRGFCKGTGKEFIFSLDKKRKFLHNRNLDKAIYNNPQYFPTFGTGCDINLYYDCFNKKSEYTYSNFQHSYGYGEKLENCLKGENFMAGSKNFMVRRIEVYKIYFE